MSSPPRRSERNKGKQIDYHLLATTGERSITTVGMASDDKPKIDNSIITESVIMEEIQDFMNDNDPESIHGSPDLMMSCIKKIETLRLQYRTQHRIIKQEIGDEQYEEVYDKSYHNMLSSISYYIRNINHCLQDGCNTKRNKAVFLKKEIDRLITSINRIVSCDMSKLTNDDIKIRKLDLIKHSKVIENLSEKLKEYIDVAASQTELEETQDQYDAVMNMWISYKEIIAKEVRTREIDKLESFNKNILNIKLQRFSGYSSSSDFYTFKSNFMKLYDQSVPKSMQADLIKNNHLEKDALSLVKNVTDINEIWDRLKEAFGDCKTLLSNKLSELNTCDVIKTRDSSKIVSSLSKIINIMKDLMNLAADHHIENELYYSDALDQIYNLLGDSRTFRWLNISCEAPKEGKWKWRQLLEFLDKEVKIHQQRVLSQMKSKKVEPAPKQQYTRKGGSAHLGVQNQNPNNQAYHTPNNHQVYQTPNNQVLIQTTCYICGEIGHTQTNGPRGMKLIQYFACRVFVEMSPQDRYNLLKSKNLCVQCLFPGAQQNQSKHQNGQCQRDFVCQHPVHQQLTTKKHVLVCEEHKSNQQNLDILQHYKSRCILRQPVPTYSKEIKLSFHSSCEDGETNAIFMFQSILVDSKSYTLFYDSGCSDFISRHQAIQQLGQRANQEYTGTISMGGVGGITSQSTNGIYSVKLPLINGHDATMTGVCLNQITQEFPMYKLNGEVIQDIHEAYAQSGGNVRTLPSVPAEVGGDVDFMIGIKYLRYFPEVIFKLPSGLTIYKSCFKNVDGSTGVIGGPHKVFTEIKKQHHHSKNFIQDQFRLFQLGYHINPDVRLLGYTDCKGDVYSSNEDEDSTINKLNSFLKVEDAGSQIQFRCVNCRGCKDCKKLQSSDETMSLKEEIEQDVINRSVKVDVSNRTSIATLPFMNDPSIYLVPNRHIALRVYNQQLKRLSSHLEDKDDVLKSEMKLQKLGYVAYVKDLPDEIQQSLQHNSISNFIPWRAVWKENSMSTPCRLVFDASMKTDSGYALNDILAKGRNNMNKLVEIFIRWRSHAVGIHTDIAKMYNSVQLDRMHWCLQRYLWEETLDPRKPPEEKVITTLIYGVKSSGNQAERALRETATIYKELYPKTYKIINEDAYVDDCMTGEKSTSKAASVADELELVLNHGGFSLKGFTFSYQKPLESLSGDGESISVSGLKWYPQCDEIQLDIPEINFAKKYRGKKPKQIVEVPENLTRRQCVSKAAEVFDIAGLITPITATLKIDLHELVRRKMDWDDVLPDSLRNVWISHFELLQEINHIRFKRAVVPSDAINLNVSTLDFGDASKDLVCASIYVRFQRQGGDYSCQLVFARSRLVPDDMSQPRAELYAALLNTHTSEVVRKSLNQSSTSKIKFTDSQIVLYWISNTNIQLKQWVRNRVAEITRLTSPSQWKYIRSNDMIADIGTRRCTSLDDVNQSSSWINGHPWMLKDESSFPAMTVNQITLSNNEINEANREIKTNSNDKNTFYSINEFDEKYFQEIQKRYQFSKYIVDPNRHRYSMVVRIVAFIRRFINIYVYKKKSPGPILTKDEINQAEMYFFRKATQEIKQFVKQTKYGRISKEQDGILIHIGRILPTDKVTALGEMTDVMKDLHPTTFCVPLVDKHSPIAISLINETHWYDPTARHSGNETTWRHILKKAYIIEGKSLVKTIRASCQRCRFIMKKTINVEMGPLSKDNLKIAPAFYISQADLAGPFLSYSQHHKRTTVKIWLLVFCCSTTTCVNIKVMERYDTTAFIQAFQRFACQVGYPHKLLIDEGGQLVKGCETMKFDTIDLQSCLHRNCNVEFATCPVGGHNEHGRVERKIREVRSSLEKMMHNERLSIIQWETIASLIANSINNMPLAIRNIKSDVEMADLITPNRLLLGRNNEQSPTGIMTVENDYDKLIRDNKRIFEAWFDCWLTSHVPTLVARPKWFSSDTDLKVGDVVLFLKQDSVLCSTYQYGKVREVERGRDGHIRRAKICYRNSSENCLRETMRSVRTLVVIHHVDEIDLSKELFNLHGQ